MRYAKPATTFEEQADLLLKRGVIGDRATLIARLSFVPASLPRLVSGPATDPRTHAAFL